MEIEEVEVKFEREGRNGIVATGSYLIDAAGRLGIRFEDACVQAEGIHFCSVTIRGGAENLSPLTQLETEHFSKNGRKNNERLACQAKIEKPGEVFIMTEEKKEETTSSEKEESDQYVKDFTELPLEKKIAKLAKLEAIALGETLSFVINSPFTIGDKVLDIMAEFGFKKEQQAKDASRPAEEAAAGKETPPSAGKAGKAGKKAGKKPAVGDQV
jgi:ferredoxin